MHVCIPFLIDRGTTDIDRMYGFSNSTRVFGKYCIAYFIHDLKNVYLIEKHSERLIIFIHHVYGMVMIYYMIYEDCFTYYGLLYFGITEISSIPLTYMKFYIKHDLKHLISFQIIRLIFAITFLIFRTCLFAYLMYLWFTDIYINYERISLKHIIIYTPGQIFYPFIILLWTTKIIKGIIMNLPK